MGLAPMALPAGVFARLSLPGPAAAPAAFFIRLPSTRRDGEGGDEQGRGQPQDRVHAVPQNRPGGGGGHGAYAVGPAGIHTQ